MKDKAAPTRPNTSRRLTVKDILIYICVLASITEAVLAFLQENTYAIISCILLEVACLCILQSAAKDAKGEPASHTKLNCLLILGCLMIPASVCYTVFLLAMGLQYDKGIYLFHTTYFVTLPQCVASTIWFVVLVRDVWKCFKSGREEDQLH